MDMEAILKALSAAGASGKVLDKAAPIISSTKGKKVLEKLLTENPDGIKKIMAGDKVEARRMMEKMISTPDGMEMAKKISQILK